MTALTGTHRLVTLTGAAGIGKTQTAVHLAQRAAGGTGAHYVSLREVGDPAVASVIFASDLDATVMVLIVDDAEPAVAPALKALLDQHSNLRIVVTSRAPLGMLEERVVALMPLDVCEATILFSQRAAQSDAAFDAVAAAPQIAEVCRQLDGVPAAIELAAARAGTLALDTIARTLPASGPAAYATIAWSYGLLNDSERMIFRRLGIFAGSFDAQTAERICDDVAGSYEVRAALSVLAHMSLVVEQSDGESPRYGLRSSVREYAREALRAADDADRVAGRYARYFCERAASVRKQIETGPSRRWVRALRADAENYRWVLHWTLAGGNDVAAGGALAAALAWYWRRSGAEGEGLLWIERALAKLDQETHPAAAARLWNAMASLHDRGTDGDAARRALATAEAANETECEAWARVFVAAHLQRTGAGTETLQSYALAAKTMRALGIRRGIAAALAGEATVRRDAGEMEAARRLLVDALAELQALGDDGDTGPVRSQLAELEFACGDVKRALELSKDTLERDRVRRCIYRLRLGQLEFARADARKALQRALRDRDDVAIAIVLQHFALMEASAGELRTAARLRGYVDGQYGQLHYRRGITEEWGYRRLVETLQNGLSVSEIVALAAQGSAWDEQRAILEATRR